MLTNKNIVCPENLLRIAKGKGPREWKIMLGYCAWLPGQLEAEIQEKKNAM